MTPHEHQAMIKGQILGSYNLPAAPIKKSEEAAPVAGEEAGKEEKKDIEVG